MLWGVSVFNKKNLLTSVLLFVSFIILMICLLLIDVRVINDTNKEIGLAFINKISTKIEYNRTLDKGSDVFLLIGIGCLVSLIILGLVQLIKRKSLFKVDKEIIVYGLVCIFIVIMWFVFDKILIINYRPVLIDGELEASYPSTHIMLVTFLLLASSKVISNYVKKTKIIKFLIVITCVFVGMTFVMRFISGMHWITDCIGGLLIGLSSYYLYLSLIVKNK